MEKNFIYTSDIETANKLTLLGFKQMKCNNDNVYCFCNIDKFVFAGTDIDESKIKYSNLIMF